METESALRAFGALSQPTRLEALRLLIAHEPEGLAAGDLAGLLSVPMVNVMANKVTIVIWGR
jgi:ArsR family transcriptional regulator, arsenate/arsenite/antimonite-responsive transcriptional repressor